MTLSIGTVVDGRFEIVDSAARGGMGIVFRALDRETHSPVAFKLLEGRALVDVGRFAREAALLAELHEPGIVRYITRGTTDDGLHYLVTEWIEGETLADRLEREGVTLHEGVSVVRLIATALANAHRLGIVHRDIKPSNVLLGDRDLERVKVIDFGIARYEREPVPLTETGVMVGTPGYMSPEQASATRTIDARSDVFSLGCVLYECLTGHVAFSGENMVAVRTKILFTDPPPVRELCQEAPEPVSALVARLLAKAPADRPADAGTLVDELVALGTDGGTTRRRVHFEPATLASPRKRHRSAVTTDPSATLVEQFVCVILAAAPTEDEPTITARSIEVTVRREDELQAVARRFEVRLELLADGSVAATASGGHSSNEIAARAARFALALQKLVTGVAMVIISATISRPDAQDEMDELIDRGCRVLAIERTDALLSELSATSPRDLIRLDEQTALLLATDFQVERAPNGSYLHDPATERTG